MLINKIRAFLMFRPLHIIAIVAAVMLSINSCCEAQVTFSRDWNAGKRSAEALDFHVKKVPGISCQTIWNQLRQLVACESRNEDSESGSPYYLTKI